MKTVARKTKVLLKWLAVVIVAAMFVPCAKAQDRRQQPQQVRPPSQLPGDPTAMPNIIVSPGEDYRIGPRDVIEVRIEDAPELSMTYQVNADGTFLMPYLKRIKAEGKTPEELSALIADGLRNRYLKDPQVIVSMKQYYSRSFFIQGSVRKPGVYQIEGRPSLVKLITVAGGLADNYGSTAFIMREKKQDKRSDSPAAGDAQSEPVMQAADSKAAQDSKAAEDPQYELRTVNISGLYKGRIDQNVFIEPGDIVTIPPIDVFFVAGEVNAPGSFPLKDGTTLRQAISLAQGTSFNAATGNGVIFREDLANGKRQEIKVDIGSVMKGKQEDIAIQANDIIIVPNSRAKSVGNALLKAFGMGAAQRGPYYRY